MGYCRLMILLSVVLCTAVITEAQQNFNYPFRHINLADGLLHKEVYSVTQDAKGFIWIVTANGLQRYDGTRFVYYPSLLNSSSQGIAPGAEMYVDNQQNLWINNYKTAEKIGAGKNNAGLYNFENVKNDPAFTCDKYMVDKNIYWSVGRHVVYYYDSTAKKNSGYSFNIFPANSHRSGFLAADSISHTTWLFPYGQLFLFNTNTGKVYSQKFNPDHHPLLNATTFSKSKFFRFVMMDSRQNIWVTTWDDVLYRYDAQTKKVSTFSLLAIKSMEFQTPSTSAKPLINCIIEDRRGIIWIGTERAGLLRYNNQKNDFGYCIAEEQNSNGIQYEFKINNLFQDKEENIWVSTDKGISIFNPYRQQFNSISHEEGNQSSISKNEIISFHQTTNGDMYVGTWGGGMAVHDRNFVFKKNLVFAGNSDQNKIWSFLQTDEKTLWIGCQHGFLLIHDIAGGSTQTYQPPELDSSTIRCMIKDSRGNIWLALHNGKIAEWDAKEKQFVRCSSAAMDSLNNSDAINAVIIDKAQNCWVSTEKGFKKFDLQKKMYTNTWLPGEKNRDAISGLKCRGITEYNDSILLIGTVNGGLNFFNKKRETFSHLTVEDGLPSNTIYALKKDKDGYVWFTTEFEIYKFNPAEKKMHFQSKGPYRLRASFISPEIYSLFDGQWLTFTTAEAIHFFPNQKQYADGANLKTEITSFRIFDKSISVDSLITENKPLRLSYTDNFFSVEFAALSFAHAQPIMYYYQLAGVDKDWVDGGNKGFANYTDLKPGTYTFNVKADDGDITGEITSFKIIITPPFWKTGWFMALVAAAIILLVYLFVKWRIKSIRDVETEKLKVQKLNAEQYKNKLELEQIINYFSSSLIDKNTVDDVLWDVAGNLIGRLGFEDCMMYLWNNDKTKMIQRAGYGPKGSIEKIEKQPFDVSAGQGVVGYVMETKEPVFITDTSIDPRYRADEMVRLSEICVPIIYNDELVGIIDSEHREKHFFTQQHIQVLSTIATLMANKIKSIESEQSLQQAKMEMMGINEKLSAAKLEALRSQMNPHFIFNCLNSIDNLIQNNDREKATQYLAKFAKLIRYILETSKNNVVPCWKDIETLQVYVELEELRLDKKFSYTINMTDEILNGDYKVPPLIIQPFVENAIHHGLLNKIEAGRELVIKIWAEDNCIHYSVEDNGVGRVKAAAYKQLNKPTHESMGMQISIDRINLFNHSNNGSVKITDLYDENHQATGTKVEIKLINQ